MNLKYAVIFEQARANRAAWVPDLPGSMTTGATLDETSLNIREAIQGHLETLKQYGDPITLPTGRSAEVEVVIAA